MNNTLKTFSDQYICKAQVKKEGAEEFIDKITNNNSINRYNDEHQSMELQNIKEILILINNNIDIKRENIELSYSIFKKQFAVITDSCSSKNSNLKGSDYQSYLSQYCKSFIELMEVLYGNYNYDSSFPSNYFSVGANSGISLIEPIETNPVQISLSLNSFFLSTWFYYDKSNSIISQNNNNNTRRQSTTSKDLPPNINIFSLINIRFSKKHFILNIENNKIYYYKSNIEIEQLFDIVEDSWNYIAVIIKPQEVEIMLNDKKIILKENYGDKYSVNSLILFKNIVCKVTSILVGSAIKSEHAIELKDTYKYGLYSEKDIYSLLKISNNSYLNNCSNINFEIPNMNDIKNSRLSEIIDNLVILYTPCRVHYFPLFTPYDCKNITWKEIHEINTKIGTGDANVNIQHKNSNSSSEDDVSVKFDNTNKTNTSSINPNNSKNSNKKLNSLLQSESTNGTKQIHTQLQNPFINFSYSNAGIISNSISTSLSWKANQAKSSILNFISSKPSAEGFVPVINLSYTNESKSSSTVIPNQISTNFEGFFINENTSTVVYYKKIYSDVAYLGGIVNLLPLFENLLYSNVFTNDSEILTKLFTIVYFILNEKIKNVQNAYENHFFAIVSLFIEKTAEISFTSYLKDIFCNIAKYLFSIIGVSKLFFEFCDHILLNEKILFKFNYKEQVEIWKSLDSICDRDYFHINMTISIAKILQFLKYYDRDFCFKFCCKNHFHMFNEITEPPINDKTQKESENNNMKDLNRIPPLVDKYRELKPLINLLNIKFLNSEHSSSSDINDILNYLSIPCSPCIQSILINSFSKYLESSKRIEENYKMNLLKKLNERAFTDIFLNLFTRCLTDIKFEIIKFFKEVFSLKFNPKFRDIISVSEESRIINTINKFIFPHNIKVDHPEVEVKDKRRPITRARNNGNLVVTEKRNCSPYIRKSRIGSLEMIEMKSRRSSSKEAIYKSKSLVNIEKVKENLNELSEDTKINKDFIHKNKSCQEALQQIEIENSNANTSPPFKKPTSENSNNLQISIKNKDDEGIRASPKRNNHSSENNPELKLDSVEDELGNLKSPLVGVRKLIKQKVIKNLNTQKKRNSNIKINIDSINKTFRENAITNGSGKYTGKSYCNVNFKQAYSIYGEGYNKEFLLELEKRIQELSYHCVEVMNKKIIDCEALAEINNSRNHEVEDDSLNPSFSLSNHENRKKLISFENSISSSGIVGSFRRSKISNSVRGLTKIDYKMSENVADIRNNSRGEKNSFQISQFMDDTPIMEEEYESSPKKARNSMMPNDTNNTKIESDFDNLELKPFNSSNFNDNEMIKEEKLTITRKEKEDTIMSIIIEKPSNKEESPKPNTFNRNIEYNCLDEITIKNNNIEYLESKPSLNNIDDKIELIEEKTEEDEKFINEKEKYIQETELIKEVPKKAKLYFKYPDQISNHDYDKSTENSLKLTRLLNSKHLYKCYELMYKTLIEWLLNKNVNNKLNKMNNFLVDNSETFANPEIITTLLCFVINYKSVAPKLTQTLLIDLHLLCINNLNNSVIIIQNKYFFNWLIEISFKYYQEGLSKPDEYSNFEFSRKVFTEIMFHSFLFTCNVNNNINSNTKYADNILESDLFDHNLNNNPNILPLYQLNFLLSWGVWKRKDYNYDPVKISHISDFIRLLIEVLSNKLIEKISNIKVFNIYDNNSKKNNENETSLLLKVILYSSIIYEFSTYYNFESENEFSSYIEIQSSIVNSKILVPDIMYKAIKYISAQEKKNVDTDYSLRIKFLWKNYSMFEFLYICFKDIWINEIFCSEIDDPIKKTEQLVRNVFETKNRKNILQSELQFLSLSPNNALTMLLNGTTNRSLLKESETKDKEHSVLNCLNNLIAMVISIVQDENDHLFWLEQQNKIMIFVILSSLNVNIKTQEDIEIQDNLMDIILFNIGFLVNRYSLYCVELQTNSNGSSKQYSYYYDIKVKIVQNIKNYFMLLLIGFEKILKILENKNSNILSFFNKNDNDLKQSAIYKICHKLYLITTPCGKNTTDSSHITLNFIEECKQVKFDNFPNILINHSSNKESKNNDYLNFHKTCRFINTQTEAIQNRLKNIFNYKFYFKKNNIRELSIKKYVSPIVKLYHEKRISNSNESSLLESSIFKASLYLENYKNYTLNKFFEYKRKLVLYKSVKKQLFSWRGYWNTKQILYNKFICKNLKTKLVNNYAHNFTKPLTKLIEDCEIYIPNFSKYNRKDIFVDFEDFSYCSLCSLQVENNLKDYHDSNTLESKKSDDSIDIKNYTPDTELTLDEKIANYNDSLYSNRNLTHENIIIVDDNSISNLSINHFNSTLNIEENYNKSTTNEVLNKEDEKISTSNEKILRYLGGNKDIFLKKNIIFDLFKYYGREYMQIIYNLDYYFFNNFPVSDYHIISNNLSLTNINNSIKSFYCCLVKPDEHFKGKVKVSQNSFEFEILIYYSTCLNNSDNKEKSQSSQTQLNLIKESISCNNPEGSICFGSIFNSDALFNNYIDKKLQYFISFNTIKYILKKTYYLRNSAVEIVTHSNKSYMFNFHSEIDRNNFINLILKNSTQFSEIKIDTITSKNKSDNIIGYELFECFRSQLSYSSNIIDTSSKYHIIDSSNNNNSLFYSSKQKEFNLLGSSLSTIKEKWVSWKLSNLDFLNILNIYAGRSLTDISQYFVFPWILTSYSNDFFSFLDSQTSNLIASNAPVKMAIKSSTKSLTSYGTKKTNSDVEQFINSIRDFGLPMGMLDVDSEGKGFERTQVYRETYNNILSEFEEENQITNSFIIGGKGPNKHDLRDMYYDSENSPYFYGTHYSNPFYTTHFLVRLFPFSKMMIEMQGNKFDDPNRLFFNIFKSFNSASTQKADVRELTPEFFYLPEMFVNQNNFNFGKRYDEFSKNKITVNHVDLPVSNKLSFNISWKKKKSSQDLKFICNTVADFKINTVPRQSPSQVISNNNSLKQKQYLDEIEKGIKGNRRNLLKKISSTNVTNYKIKDIVKEVGDYSSIQAYNEQFKKAIKFIISHRKVLESEYVSVNLSKWVDLIFGANQRKEEARKACNLFIPSSYENVINYSNYNLEELQVKMRMLEFGLTPKQLMYPKLLEPKSEKDSARKGKQITESKEIKNIEEISQYKKRKILQFQTKFDIKEIVKHFATDNILKIKALDNEKLLMIYNNSNFTILKIITSEKSFTVHSQNSKPFNSPDIPNKITSKIHSYNYMSKNFSILNKNIFHQFTANSILLNNEEQLDINKFKDIFSLISSLQNSNRSTLIYGYQNKPFLANGGYWDGRINVNNLFNGKTMNYFTGLYPITLLKMDNSETFAFAGNTAGALIVFRVDEMNWIEYKTLVNHYSEISCINVCNKLNAAVSASFDGGINIYTFPEMKLIRAHQYNHLLITQIFLSMNPIPSMIIEAFDLSQIFEVNSKTDNLKYNSSANKNNMDSHEKEKSKFCKKGSEIRDKPSSNTTTKENQRHTIFGGSLNSNNSMINKKIMSQKSQPIPKEKKGLMNRLSTLNQMTDSNGKEIKAKYEFNGNNESILNTRLYSFSINGEFIIDMPSKTSYMVDPRVVTDISHNDFLVSIDFIIKLLLIGIHQ